MKRLVWLLLAVFVTALAQVSPVDVGSQSPKACSCCDAPVACGTRDCGMPPAACAQNNLLAEQPSPSASTTARKKAVRVYRLAFRSLFQTREIFSVRNSRLVPSVSDGRVPLFKTQCSFLI